MLRKNRKLPIIVGSLAAIALVSVGFSAWFVGGQATASHENTIDMKVGKVNDARLKMVITNDTAKSLVFDAQGPTIANGKISASADSQTPVLSFQVDFTVGFDANWDSTNNVFVSTPNAAQGQIPYSASDANTQVKSAFDKVKFDFVPTNHVSDYVATMNGTIGAQPFGTLNSTTGAGSFTWSIATPVSEVYDTGVNKISGTADFSKTDQNVVTGSITFYFNFGSFFGYKNPTQFLEGDGKTLDQAIANLRELYKVKYTSFTLTLSTLKSA